VVSACRRQRGVWLTVTLPDGYPGVFPVADTDFGGLRVAVAGDTALSAEGIRRLREMAAVLAGKDRNR
jgi:hypothetical protein